MDWAYITEGRTKALDYPKRFFVPNEAPKNVRELFEKIFTAISDDVPKDEVSSVIGFDGNNWFTGGCAKAETFLSNAWKETVESTRYYSMDNDGREITLMHGFIGSGNQCPDKIPHLSLDELKHLNDVNIIPIWGSNYVEKVKTIFVQPEKLNQMKSVTDVLPQELVQKLQQAAESGTPILLKQEGEGQWQDITQEKFFQKAINSIKAKTEEATQKLQANIPINEELNQSTSFLKSLYDDGKLTDNGKIAAVAAFLATAAIGYGIYSWCNREKPDTKLETATIQVSKDKNELKQPARAH